MKIDSCTVPLTEVTVVIVEHKIAVGNSRVIPRFHPMSVGWNLGLTREFSTPNKTSAVIRKVCVVFVGCAGDSYFCK